MSKAFVSEDAIVPDDSDALPDRPESLPITRRGFDRLRAELEALERSKDDPRRVRLLSRILETVYLVEPPTDASRIAFGVRVALEDEAGARFEYEVVGPDEADAAVGRISVKSPVARALLGKRCGDVVTLRRPKGDVDVTILAIELDSRANIA